MNRLVTVIFVFLSLVVVSSTLCAEWYIIKNEDLLTSTKKISIYTYAIAKDYSSYDKPQLVIRIDYEKGLDIYVNLEKYIKTNDFHSVLYRIDNENILSSKWIPSTDGNASFCPKIINRITIYDFLSILEDASELTIRVESYRGDIYTTKFKLEGLKEMLFPYKKDLMFFMTCFKIDMLLDSIYKTKYENTTNIEYICEKNELSPKIFEGFYINPKKSISINSSGIINYYDLNISCTCDYAKDFVEKMSQNTYMEHCINKTYFLKHKIQIFNPGNKLIFVVKNWPLLAYKERKLNMVVSSNDGILIFDIKNPVNPVLSQRLNEHKNVRRAYVSTNKLFLIDNSEKILIFDSNISSTVPQIWDFKKYISDISVIAGRAYVASNENGLLIFDISDSSNLTQIGNFDTKGNAIDVYVKDYYAYIAEGEYGIEIVDISDPITPILIENFDTLLNKAMNVFLKDNYLFVGDGNYLLIYDISSPLNPVQLGHYEIDSQIVDIYIEDDYAYIASTSNGITILNISDPRYPKFVKKIYQDFRIFSISGL